MYAVNTTPSPWETDPTDPTTYLLNENAELQQRLATAEQHSRVINARAEAVAEVSLQRELRASHTTQHVEHIVQLEHDSNQQLGDRSFKQKVLPLN